MHRRGRQQHADQRIDHLAGQRRFARHAGGAHQLQAIGFAEQGLQHALDPFAQQRVAIEMAEQQLQAACLARLAADGKLAPGAVWTQASVIGSRFEASYAMDGEHVIPTLRGRAHISAEATLLIEDEDPFGWGIRL